MYYLMNKDRQVALLRIVSGEYAPDKKLETIEIYDRLPLGVANLNRWAESRRAYKHNKHLKQLVKKMGGDDIENYIRLTHLTSINDTFWVKQETESITWDDVSLYRNQFTETISMIAFVGTSIKDFDFTPTSPELSCDGSFRKRFRKEKKLGEYGSDIFIYKRGGEVGAGIEPYCETLASEIANHISPDNSVSYSRRTPYNKLASRCNIFTNEKTGYISYSRVGDMDNLSLSDALRYFTKIGAEQKFREMIVIDALCFNEDRHAGNYGILFDNDTLEIQTMAPVFDLNIALFSNAVPEDFKHIGDYIHKISPKLGNDFTEMGQFAANNATCRDRIKDMKDFTFSFRGDEIFSPERVKCLERIVQKQAAAILSQDKLKTNIVF